MTTIFAYRRPPSLASIFHLILVVSDLAELLREIVHDVIEAGRGGGYVGLLELAPLGEGDHPLGYRHAARRSSAAHLVGEWEEGRAAREFMRGSRDKQEKGEREGFFLLSRPSSTRELRAAFTVPCVALMKVMGAQKLNRFFKNSRKHRFRNSPFILTFENRIQVGSF